MNNGIKNLFGSLVALVLIISLALFVAQSDNAKTDKQGSLVMQRDKSQQQKAQVEQPREKRYAIGNLGGAPVKMDLDWVEYIEYEEDPVAFDPKWKTYKAPKRTYNSYVRSFGFEFDYKRGVLKDSKHWAERREAHKTRGNRIENNSWVDFGMRSGSSYEEEFDKQRAQDSLQSLAKGQLNKTYKKLDDGSVEAGFPLDVLSAEGRKKAIKYQYIEDVYGLEYWRLPEDAVVTQKVGIMETEKIPLRTTIGAEDVYIAKDEEDNVIAYIRCRNRKYKEFSSCAHFFNMYNDVKLGGRLDYTFANLENWQEIQATAERYVRSMKVEPNALD